MNQDIINPTQELQDANLVMLVLMLVIQLQLNVMIVVVVGIQDHTLLNAHNARQENGQIKDQKLAVYVQLDTIPVKVHVDALNVLKEQLKVYLIALHARIVYQAHMLKDQLTPNVLTVSQVPLTLTTDKVVVMIAILVTTKMKKAQLNANHAGQDQPMTIGQQLLAMIVELVNIKL